MQVCEAYASLPQKVVLVADLVRGKPVGQALNITVLCPKGHEIVKRCLESAIVTLSIMMVPMQMNPKAKVIYAEKGTVLKPLPRMSRGNQLLNDLPYYLTVGN